MSATNTTEKMNYNQFKKHSEQVVASLDVIFAFSVEQFEQGLAKKGWEKENIVRFIGGGYSPKELFNANIQKLKDLEAKKKDLTKTQITRYHAYPYLHEEMGAALAAADLVISRAGASTLGEYPLFGLPAILVPYPHAWRYQKVNADYLVQRGAAILLEDGRLHDQILPTVNALLNDPQKRTTMRAAMQRLSHPQAAAEIGRQLLALSRERR